MVHGSGVERGVRRSAHAKRDSGARNENWETSYES
jgi:hypothetical protein